MSIHVCARKLAKFMYDLRRCASDECVERTYLLTAAMTPGLRTSARRCVIAIMQRLSSLAQQLSQDEMLYVESMQAAVAQEHAIPDPPRPDAECIYRSREPDIVKFVHWMRRLNRVAAHTTIARMVTYGRMMKSGRALDTLARDAVRTNILCRIRTLAMLIERLCNEFSAVYVPVSAEDSDSSSSSSESESDSEPEPESDGDDSYVTVPYFSE